MNPRDVIREAIIANVTRSPTTKADAILSALLASCHTIVGPADMEKAVEAVGWQDMDGAPKDGTRFWGSVGDDAIAMLWHEGFEAFVSSWRRMEMAPGYTIDGEPFKDHSPVIHHPTGWMPMPLPAAPKPALTQEKTAEGEK